MIHSDEARDLADDIRELFDDLAASLPHEQRAHSGEFRPSLDVVETNEAIEIVVDVSGIPADALRILFRAGVVIVAGEKAAPTTSPAQTYHLVEREFGRFARVIRAAGAFDVQKARAVIHQGELIVTLPKLTERRGRAQRIPISGGRQQSE